MFESIRVVCLKPIRGVRFSTYVPSVHPFDCARRPSPPRRTTFSLSFVILSSTLLPVPDKLIHTLRWASSIKLRSTLRHPSRGFGPQVSHRRLLPSETACGRHNCTASNQIRWACHFRAQTNTQPSSSHALIGSIPFLTLLHPLLYTINLLVLSLTPPDRIACL